MILNIDQVVSISIQDIKPSSIYTWKSKRTFLGMTTRKEGVNFLGFKEYTMQQFFGNPDNSRKYSFNLEKRDIYVKPCCTIHLSDGRYIERYFETLREAEDYGNGLALRVPNRVNTKGDVYNAQERFLENKEREGI